MGRLPPERHRDQGRHCREQGAPELHRRGPWRTAAAPGPAQGWGRSLDEAVADHPQAQEAAHLPESPAQGGLKEHRQRHHEPHIPGTEEEKSRQREDVDASGLGEQGRERRPGLHPADVAGKHQGAEQGQGQAGRHGQDGSGEPNRW